MTTAYTTGRLRLKPGTLGAPILETETREVAKVLYHGGSDDAEAHANARRLLALWNAAEGIPTETLEAGVVVVPVDDIRAIHGWAGELIDIYPATYAESLGKVIQERTCAALSRRQPNGGEGR